MRTIHKIGLAASVAVALGLSACGEEQQEHNRTHENRLAINSAIPIPQINFSLRRWVLSQFYYMLERPRLETCTVITSRGGDHTEIGVAPTYGSPVNLSNQMTSPSESEPDSIYPGTNDQTIVVLRNGVGIVAEGDTNSVLGECPATLKKPDTALQQIIDYNMRVEPKFSFLATRR